MIEELVGKTVNKIDGSKGSDEIHFFCTDGTRYRMLHHQDCCESVYIEDIIGDLEDLLNTPILTAEGRYEDADALHGAAGLVQRRADDGYGDTATWTFYEFRTIKGSVTIRWYGSSNGYYSETASFDRY